MNKECIIAQKLGQHILLPGNLLVGVINSRPSNLLKY